MMPIIKRSRKYKLMYSDRKHIIRYLTRKNGSWLEGRLQKGTRKLSRVMKLLIIFIVLLVFHRYVNVLKSIHLDTLNMCSIFCIIILH